jgi:hypothetical protein
MTQRSALAFLAAFKADEYTLQDSSPWQNVPGAKCDAYIFSDGEVSGYVSFGRPPDGDQWVVKSLKFNNRAKR